MRAQKIAEYLQKTLKTPEVKKAAAEAGYTGKCPLADAT